MTDPFDEHDVEQLRRLLTKADLLLVAVGAALVLTGSVAAGLGTAATGACAWALATLVAR